MRRWVRVVLSARPARARPKPAGSWPSSSFPEKPDRSRYWREGELARRVWRAVRRAGLQVLPLLLGERQGVGAGAVPARLSRVRCRAVVRAVRRVR
jgi:hypothetical protein